MTAFALTRLIRPFSLVFLGSVFLLFSLLATFGRPVPQIYIDLLESWGQIVISAYFLGRSAEKITTTMHQKKAPTHG